MIQEGRPQPGYYKRKLVRGGPWIPVRLWVDPAHDGRIAATVGIDDRADFAIDIWTWVAGNPISEDEYNYLIANLKHVRDHRPDDPLNTPTAPVDFATMGTRGDGARGRADELMAEPGRELQVMEDAQASTLWIKRANAVKKTLEVEMKDAAAVTREQLSAIEQPYRTRISQLEDLVADELRLLHDWRRVRNYPAIATEYGARGFTRDTQRIEVVDIRKVPTEFLTVDMTKLRAALKLGDVAGVVVHKEPSTVVS